MLQKKGKSKQAKEKGYDTGNKTHISICALLYRARDIVKVYGGMPSGYFHISFIVIAYTH